MLLLLLKINTELTQGGAVAHAMKLGLHPSDGPSERGPQAADDINFVVVLYQGTPRPKLRTIGAYTLLLLSIKINTDLTQGGAVAYAMRPGLHPSDGPSERNTHNADAIYFIVVVLYQGAPRPKLRAIGAYALLLSLLKVNTDLTQGGVVAYAMKPGLHPSDGPSVLNTQNADAIYLVVGFLQVTPFRVIII